MNKWNSLNPNPEMPAEGSIVWINQGYGEKTRTIMAIYKNGSFCDTYSGNYCQFVGVTHWCRVAIPAPPHE